MISFGLISISHIVGKQKMGYYNIFRSYINLVIICYLSFFVVVFDISSAQNLRLRAVNLGNWLVAEGWMKSSLFDGIPNNDLLDGTQIQLKSTKLQRYLCAENGGGTNLVANRQSASGWETFRLWRLADNYFGLRVFNKKFMGRDSGNKIIAVADKLQEWEVFEIVRSPGDANRIRLKNTNGFYLQVKSETEVAADYNGGLGWEDNNPAVFIMSVLSTLHGEFQLTNGYGFTRATQILQVHRNTYITDEDFKFMSSNGLNSVRIPVGWWIAFDPSPPKPFIGGSLQALDNAFSWAQKYGMKVVIDLHAIEGSQNGWEHSGTRDGYQEWGDDYMARTVKGVEFLAERYANNPTLIAIELMNEPLAPGVDLDTLKRYYKEGYDAVRRHTSNAYVIFSNRLGPADPKELLSFANGLSRVAIDVHYYSLYTETFKQMNVEQHINFIYNNRASNLNEITTNGGPLIFVGEWSAEWDVRGASMEEYQRFGKALLDVYGRASFGWAYWSYKCQYDHWSLKWMIENNYINLK